MAQQRLAVSYYTRGSNVSYPSAQPRLVRLLRISLDLTRLSQGRASGY